jgi:glycerol-3-phosphate dehydrogenase
VAAVTTSQISRDHIVTFSPSGLVSVNGGKWTTFRLMAEDTISKTIKASKLNVRHRDRERERGVADSVGQAPLETLTRHTALWGAEHFVQVGEPEWRYVDTHNTPMSHLTGECGTNRRRLTNAGVTDTAVQSRLMGNYGDHAVDVVLGRYQPLSQSRISAGG